MAQNEWFRTYFSEPYGEIYNDYILDRRSRWKRRSSRATRWTCSRSDGTGLSLRLRATHGVPLAALPFDGGTRSRPGLPAPRHRNIARNRFIRATCARSFPRRPVRRRADLFNSFGYFDEAHNQRVVNEFARVLKPGGQLLIDMANLVPLIDITKNIPRPNNK
jgi:SAM-dependent methyltransferase